MVKKIALTLETRAVTCHQTLTIETVTVDAAERTFDGLRAALEPLGWRVGWEETLPPLSLPERVAALERAVTELTGGCGLL